MRSRGRSLATNTGLAFIGDLFAKGGMFVALLLLAHGLSVDEFARLGVAMAAMLIVTSVLDGGIGTLTTREGAADPSRRLGLLRIGAAARLPLVALCAAACVIAGAVAGQIELGVIVLVAALVNTAQVTLFAVFRSAQTLLNEAVAKTICGLSYPPLCFAALALGHRSASAVLVAMVIGPAATLPTLMLETRRALTTSGSVERAWTLLKESAPFGLMAVATLVYYRSPILMMGVFSSHAQTASYSVASNIAFGLLMLPAAFATGLLPRLAAEADPVRRARLIRRAVWWSTGVLAVIEGVVAASAWWLIALLYGHGFESAFAPLLILLVSGLAIGAAGVVGTALIAADRKRVLIVQVIAALATNLVAGAALIPILAATGAALATLLTEAVSLAILVFAYRRPTAQTQAPLPRPSPVREPVLAP